MKINRLLICSGLFSLLTPLSAHAVLISYNDFSDLTGLSINDSASALNPVAGSPRLRLTDDLMQRSSAYLSNSISLFGDQDFASSFSTAFQFQLSMPMGLSDDDGLGADGISFIIQPHSNDLTGWGGGGLGYGGMSNSVAIEFDSWNSGQHDLWNGNHVGINLDGNLTSVAQTNVAQRLNDGIIWSAWIDYDDLGDLLEVRLSDNNARPVDPLVSFSLNLTDILGSSYAYFGFGSGTGGGGGVQDILSWQLVDNYTPFQYIGISEPSSIGLLLAGLYALRRRISVTR